jgi:hypothetical protein
MVRFSSLPLNLLLLCHLGTKDPLRIAFEVKKEGNHNPIVVLSFLVRFASFVEKKTTLLTPVTLRMAFLQI